MLDDDLWAQLRYLLNLPTLATPQDLVTELEKLMQRLSAAETAAQSRRPDPAEWVPMSQHKAVADELAKLQASIAQEQAAAAVAAAMSAGKLAPALNAWALAYASRDLAGFEQWAAAAPVVVSTAGASPAREPGALTDEDRLACALLGLDEAAFAAHKRTITQE